MLSDTQHKVIAQVGQKLQRMRSDGHEVSRVVVFQANRQAGHVWGLVFRVDNCCPTLTCANDDLFVGERLALMGLPPAIG
eukprot:15476612-Alexandrium_andersonii.AAC.1